MFKQIKNKIYFFLYWFQKWTKTDIFYLARGGFWLTLAQVISSLMSFVLSIAYANLLPKDIFGIYKYILSIYGILSAFSLTGFKTAISQSAARGYEGILRFAYFKNLKWNLLITAASFVLSIYYFLNHNYILSVSMMILGIFSPFLNSAGFYSAFLNGKRYFKHSSTFIIINNVISALCVIGALLFSNNVIVLVLIYFSVNTLITTFLFIKTLKFKMNDEIDQTSIEFGKHLSIMNVLGAGAVYLDKILIFHYLGAAQLAIYSFAIAVPEQLNSVLKNIYTLALPKFANKPIEEIKKYTWQKIFKFGLILITMIFFIILFIPYIFKTFFPDYKESIIFSQIFSLASLTILMYIPISIMHAKNKIKELYQYNTFTSIFQILLLIVFIYFWGLWGAILAQLLGRYVNLISSMVLLKRLKV